jgi:hypothetical protein
MPQTSKALSMVRGAAGAIVGGVVGYWLFFWLIQQGLYAMVLPGALVGLGFGLGARCRSVVAGIVCSVGAIALGVFLEWRFMPFVRDDSLGYFLAHLHQVNSVHLLMIALGGGFGGWFGVGRHETRLAGERDSG